MADLRPGWVPAVEGNADARLSRIETDEAGESRKMEGMLEAIDRRKPSPP